MYRQKRAASAARFRLNTDIAEMFFVGGASAPMLFDRIEVEIRFDLSQERRR